VGGSRPASGIEACEGRKEVDGIIVGVMRSGHDRGVCINSFRTVDRIAQKMGER
jgi:hypothetical protein